MSRIHQIDPEYSPEEMRVWKQGVRVLGVAESFQKEDSKSIVVGVVMRGDKRIDGSGICHPTVGGMDATSELTSMFNRLKRDDIRAWILGGSIISWFNVVDILKLSKDTNTPVACVSYHESEGLEKYLRDYFPSDWQSRLAIVNQTGKRHEVLLSTNHSVFVTSAGMSLERAIKLIDNFTIDGRIPEPVRVARILAATFRRDFRKGSNDE